MEPKNNGRQVLWIKGDGSDGKGVVMSVIRSIVGESAAALNKDSYSNRFFYSSVYGKRLITYGDCKTPKILESEKIHQITGQDTVQVEFKGQTAFPARMKAKVWICSNLEPEIGSKAHHRSRLIYLEVAPNSEELIRTGDNRWEEKLKNEVWALLYRAEQAYQSLCPKDGNIKLSDDLGKLIDNQCSSTDEDVIEAYLVTHVKKVPGTKTKRIDIQQSFQKFYKEVTGKSPSPMVEKDLKSLLFKRFVVKPRRLSVGQSRQTVYEDIKIFPKAAYTLSDDDEVLS